MHPAASSPGVGDGPRQAKLPRRDCAPTTIAMARNTIFFAALLIVLGVGAYLVTGMQSWTALIPAIAGALLLVCGLIGLDPNKRKHAMHAAVLLAVLGFAGGAPGVIKLLKWAAGGVEPARPAAVWVQTLMSAVLLPYIVMCVKSFIDARRGKATA